MGKILANTDTGLQNGLLAYYKLDGNSNDSVGSNNGTPTNITWQQGKINDGALFNSSLTSRLIFGNVTALQNSSQATFSFFLNLESANFWSYLSIVGASNNMIDIRYSGNTGYGIQVAIFNALAGSTINTDTTSGTTKIGSFVYITVVYDGTQAVNNNRVKIYFDGIQQTVSNSGTVPTSLTASTAGLSLGYNSQIAYPFSGMLDEVAIWNRALSSTEISQLYNNDKGKPYPFFRMHLNTLPDFPTSIATPVSRWKLDGNGNDSISTNHASTISNVTWTNGKLNQCAYFDGTITTNLEVPSSTPTFSFIQNTGVFTINFWMRIDNPTAPFNYIMGDTGGTNGFYIESHYGDLYIFLAGNTSWVFPYGASLVSDTNWSMYTITGDASNIKFYKNGILKSTWPPFTLTSSGNSTANLFLGSIDSNGTNAKPHYKDDIAIWNTTLSSTDISNLYNYYNSSKILKN